MSNRNSHTPCTIAILAPAREALFRWLTISDDSDGDLAYAIHGNLLAEFHFRLVDFTAFIPASPIDG